MRDTTCSVPDVVSRGGACAALTVSGPQPAYLLGCSDPDCGCAACLLACDGEAERGRIPTNFQWWLSQTFYPVALPLGETGAR